MNPKEQPSQLEKAQAFRALHEREGAFIIANPWDVGSARLLAHLGFEALATISMGYAFSRGRLDNTDSRHANSRGCDGVAERALCRLSRQREHMTREVARAVRPGGHVALVDFIFTDECVSDLPKLGL